MFTDYKFPATWKKQKHIQEKLLTDQQTDRLRKMNRQTDRQIDRQTDRQTDNTIHKTFKVCTTSNFYSCFVYLIYLLNKTRQITKTVLLDVKKCMNYMNTTNAVLRKVLIENTIFTKTSLLNNQRDNQQNTEKFNPPNSINFICATRNYFTFPSNW